jgi:hypothetical protein
MMDNNKNIFENIGKSIKTNYKQKIKRVNSKPNISRTKNLINCTINNEPIKLINHPNQKHNQDNNIKEYLTNNQPEESYSSFYRNDQNSSYIKRKEHEKTKRVINSNYQEPKPYKKQLNNYNAPKDNWVEMLYHPTENKNMAKKVINSKTFQSNIFQRNEGVSDITRHSKETKYSDRLHKTQITTLPGCVKRGKNDIKDDKYFIMRNSESYLYKVQHDYNSNLNFGPLTREEEKVQNYFPVEQRYHGSYHRGVKDNDIFNLNKNEGRNNNVFIPGKKIFKDNNAFKSQIIFI